MAKEEPRNETSLLDQLRQLADKLIAAVSPAPAPVLVPVRVRPRRR